MASATNSVNLYSRNSSTLPYTLTAYFNENSTSTPNNTSSVTVTATLSAQNIAFEESNAGTLAIYWHDNKDNTDVLKNSATINSCGMSPYTSQSVTSTFDTPHNSDGTLSGYAYAVWTLNKNYGGYAPNSGNVATANTSLTTIPRAATLNLDATSITVGDTFWATNDPYVSGFTYTLSASNANGSYTFYTKQNVTMTTINSGVSATNFYRFLSSTQRYADVTFTLTTYSGNTTIGTNTKSLRVNANPNDLPTVTISSVDTGKAVNGTNRTTLDLTGSNKRIINQWNTISATWSATTGYNTNIASVSINGATVSSSPSTLNNISNSLSITATNGRGYSKTVTENDLTFISYEAPSIVPTLKRNTSTDGHANLTFTGMFYNVDFGAESNTLTLNWYVREKGTQNYTQGATTLTYTTNADNRTYKEAATISLVNPLDQVNGLFDYTKTYEFKFVAIDKITSYTIDNVILTRGIPNFVVFKNAVMANGQRIDDISGQISTLLNTLYPIGKIEIFYDNADHSNYMGFTWQRISGAYLYAGAGAIQYVGSNTSGTPSTNDTGYTTLTADQIPSHKHDTWERSSGASSYPAANRMVDTWGTGSSQAGWAASMGYSTSNVMQTSSTGGGQGHTHSLNNHTHSVTPYRIEVAIWRRTA